MKNYEKYADEIKGYKDNFCKDFVIPHVLKTEGCYGVSCSQCSARQLLWLLEDCEEAGVNWSKVKVDTPILVRDDERGKWERGYFAKFEDGIVYAWSGGNTSWSAEGHTFIWNYVKLAESEDAE